MLRRWSHGHSLGVGALGALALYGYAPYFLLGAGVAFGAAGVCLAIVGVRVGRSIGEAWRFRVLGKRPDIVPSVYAETSSSSSVRETRSELIGRLHHDLTMLAGMLPRGKRTS